MKKGKSTYKINTKVKVVENKRKCFKKQLSSKPKSSHILVKIKKTQKKKYTIKKKKISKRDFLIEIIKEYNLSKDVKTFEKRVKKLFNDTEDYLGKQSNFRFLFSKILTKAYIKSKLTYDFKPKDLEFIKQIINKINPCHATTESKNEATIEQIRESNLKIVSRLIGSKF